MSEKKKVTMGEILMYRFCPCCGQKLKWKPNHVVVFDTKTGEKIINEKRYKSHGWFGRRHILTEKEFTCEDPAMDDCC